MSAYGRDLDEPQLDRAWSQFNSQDEVDFGNLPEALQRDVIQKVHLPDLKIWLENALNQPATEIDTTPWSLETYAATLQRVITSVDGPGSITWIPPKRLLEQFLKPEKFHFLRSKLPEAR